jgi:hypothetical protein
MKRIIYHQNSHSCSSWTTGFFNLTGLALDLFLYLAFPHLPFYTTHLIPMLLPLFKPSLQSASPTSSLTRRAIKKLSKTLPTTLRTYLLLAFFVYLNLTVTVKHVRRMWYIFMDVGAAEKVDEARDSRFPGMGQKLSEALDTDENQDGDQDGSSSGSWGHGQRLGGASKPKRVEQETGGVFGMKELKDELDDGEDGGPRLRRQKLPGVKNVDDILGFGLKHGAFGGGMEKFEGKGRRLGD